MLVPLAVRFSVSSGCARRHSVSTYAAILVLPSMWLYGYFFSLVFCELPGSVVWCLSLILDSSWPSLLQTFILLHCLLLLASSHYVYVIPGVPNLWAAEQFGPVRNWATQQEVSSNHPKPSSSPPTPSMKKNVFH